MTRPLLTLLLLTGLVATAVANPSALPDTDAAPDQDTYQDTHQDTHQDTVPEAPPDPSVPSVPAAAPPPAAGDDGPAGSEPAPQGRPRGPFGEAVDVNLVELYVTVTGKGGEPVRGLAAEAFTVLENGVEQEVSSLVDAADLPLTLGLAVDTSASMFVKLPKVVATARDLLAPLESGRDRAFLAAFGPDPRLTQPLTDEVHRVRNALRGLQPEGSTPLWASIVQSLDELARVRGKRALVVFFDGADDDGDVPYREALRRAEQVGVPIYLIVMNNEAARTEGREFRGRSFLSRLSRLAAAGGGEVLFVRTDADLAATYERIERELRSYYLLTYYPQVPKGEGGRREVVVRASGEALAVRTLSGYEPGR